MEKRSEYLISLNGEYLYSSVNGGMYAPLRINDIATKKIQAALEKQTTDKTSCISNAFVIWRDGKFMLGCEFNMVTKCTAGISNPSTRTKTEMCFKKLCNGNCRDDFMRNVVAKNILPELYKSKQK